MRLATIRRPDGTTAAARLDGDELVLLPYPDVVALLAEPGWRDAAAAAGRRTVPLAGADLAPTVRPAKVICVGPQLPQPHRGDGPGAPRPSDAVHQVPRHADRARTTTWSCPRRRRASTGRSSSASSIGRAGPPGRRGRRRRPASPATPLSTTSRCGTGSAARPSGTRARTSRRRRRSGPSWSPATSSATRRGRASVDLEVTCRVDGQTMQTRPHLRPPVQPGRHRGLRLAVHDPAARATSSPPAPPAASAPAATRRCSSPRGRCWRPPSKGSAPAAT